METNCLNKLFDANGVEIKHLAHVLVPDPNETDIHSFEFIGVAVDFLDNGNVIVEDYDGDFFEIEASRLEIQ